MSAKVPISDNSLWNEPIRSPVKSAQSARTKEKLGARLVDASLQLPISHPCALAQ